MRLGRMPRRYSKHFRARGRIALSGVDLRPPGPGGGSKRKSFREVAGLKPRRARKVKETCSDRPLSSLSDLSSCQACRFEANSALTNHPPPCSGSAQPERCRDRRAVRLDIPHEDLFRPGLRSFRRPALLRSRRRAAEIARRGAALAVRPRPAARRPGRNGRRARMPTRRRRASTATRCGCPSSAMRAG